MVTTKQSRILNHHRAALGLTGRVDRDQLAGQYRLLDGERSVELGARWREALQTLKALAPQRSPSGPRR